MMGFSLSHHGPPQNYFKQKYPLVHCTIKHFLAVSFMVISIPNTLQIWREASYIGIILMFGTQIVVKILTMTKWHQNLNANYKKTVAERKKNKNKKKE